MIMGTCQHCGGNLHPAISTPEQGAAQREALFVALKRILAEPYGCRFCDSGKLRTPNNPAKDHDDNCGFAMGRRAISDSIVEVVATQIAEAVATEREACAKIAENRDVYGYIADIGCIYNLERVAKAIRARAK